MCCSWSPLFVINIKVTLGPLMIPVHAQSTKNKKDSLSSVGSIYNIMCTPGKTFFAHKNNNCFELLRLLTHAQWPGTSIIWQRGDQAGRLTPTPASLTWVESYWAGAPDRWPAAVFSNTRGVGSTQQTRHESLWSPDTFVRYEAKFLGKDIG